MLSPNNLTSDSIGFDGSNIRHHELHRD